MDRLEKNIGDYTEAFRLGKEEGLKYFFNQFNGTLVYYSLRITGNQPVSEDIVNDVFLKIWDRHESFSEAKLIRSWLYTTTRNDSINWLRQQEREKKHSDEFSTQVNTTDTSNWLTDMTMAEVVAEVHATINSLPKGCRKIFELLYIHGKTVRETATELHVSVSTVKNQKARGLIILRKKFPELSYDFLEVIAKD